MGLAERDALGPAARVENLSVDFAGRRALTGLNLNFPRGQLTVILGPSGAGKTTLLRAFNRLNECFPQADTAGTVKLRFQEEWVDVYRDGFPLSELRRRVGMVFQNPQVLPVSVERNLALPLRLVAERPKKEIPGRVEGALREAHLWEEVKDRLGAPALTLSGGQQQRLCLARALALEPEFLLLDEPTASLDFRAAEQVEQLLLSLKERYTLIAVSHSLSQARRLADRMVVLKAGAVVRLLEPADFQNPETFRGLVEEIF